MPELRPLKSPALRRHVAVCPSALVTGSHAEVAPSPGHPWSQAWHGLCTALSLCPIVAFPDGLHPDQIVYREKKNVNSIIKITCCQNFESSLGPASGEQSLMLTFHAWYLVGLCTQSFSDSKCYIKCDLCYIIDAL